MTTGTAPVPGGGAAGWVSGDPAGMAGGALVKVSFDLGNDWRRYVAIQLGATAAGNTIDSMTAYGADAVGEMPLDVVSQDVVPVEAESGGGRIVGDGGVRAAEVVVLHPGLQLSGTHV